MVHPILKTLALTIHDFWLWLCDSAHAIYCAVLCTFASMLMKRPRKLLYAHLDPTTPSTSEYRCVPVDITPAVSAYYAVDTVLSCFTLQEWLKRFNIRANFVTLVFVRDADIYRARLDLNEDIETYTGQTVYTDLNQLPGVSIHRTDKTHAD